jgi:hypothetical protein
MIIRAHTERAGGHVRQMAANKGRKTMTTLTPLYSTNPRVRQQAGAALFDSRPDLVGEDWRSRLPRTLHVREPENCPLHHLSAHRNWLLLLDELDPKSVNGWEYGFASNADKLSTVEDFAELDRLWLAEIDRATAESQ